MLKRFLKFGIPAVLLILFVVLTAVLCSSTVFQGTYKGNGPNYEKDYYEITFYGNTFDFRHELKSDVASTTEGEGFYKVYDGKIYLDCINPSTSDAVLTRKSVFVVTIKQRNNYGYGNNEWDVELKNHGAIWLQVFYSVGTVASAAFLVVQIIRQRKAKK